MWKILSDMDSMNFKLLKGYYLCFGLSYSFDTFTVAKKLPDYARSLHSMSFL